MARTGKLLAGALGLLAIALPAGEVSGEEETEPTPVVRSAPRLLGPRTGEDRTKALRKFGGNSATEKSVAAALDWLGGHQTESG